MSKKNNKATRRRHLEAAAKREKEELEKRKQKQEQKKSKEKLAVAAVATKKTKKKGIRIKKNVVIRGIKVRDAESKRKVKEVLAAEEAMREMLVDEAAPPAASSERMVMG